MITADALSEQIRRLLGDDTEAAMTDGGRISILTPAEYPNRDGVVVWVEPDGGDGYIVTDHGEADAGLVGRVHQRALAAPAAQIARRLDVAFDGGRVVARVQEAELAEACWRVAQAAAAIAEAETFHKPTPRRDAELVDLLASELRRRDVEIERERTLEGASGHEHRASLYVPVTETVIEPIGTDRPWNVASAVYVQFGDLRTVNGYRTLAVLDDREGAIGVDVAGLLRQVGDVTEWSRHEQWLRAVAGDSLL